MPFITYCYARKGLGRRILMIADRIVVQLRAANLLPGETKAKETEQRHYEAHKNKISSIAVHPDKKIIATGEASSISWIHFWDFRTLQTLKKIRTLHNGGIVNMVFSYDGKYIASVGMNNDFNVQIADWELERIIAFRNISTSPILDIRFDPINPLTLAVCGMNFIMYLKVKGTNLEAYLLLPLDHMEKPVATCLDFLFFQQQKKLKTELLVGTSKGDILVSSLEKEGVAIALPKAHEAPITHIKISCCLSTIIRIFTAAEDSLVKIWSSNLRIIRIIDLRVEVMPKVNEFIEDTPVHMNPNLDPSKIAIIMPNRHGTNRPLASASSYPQETVQSLEFWHKVDTQPSENHGRLPYLLISTKSGFVVELLLEEPPNEKKTEEQSENVKNFATLIEPVLPQKDIEDKATEYLFAALIFRSQKSMLSATSEQILKKQLSSVHPFRSYIAIIGSNEELIIWDFDKKIILVKLIFDPTNPSTALKWHPKEDIFLVGFNSGMIHIYQIQDSLSIDLKKELQVNLDSFLPPVADSPILNLEFNDSGDLLAVSYGNSKQAKDDSFVQVYISKNMTNVDDVDLTSEGKYLHYFDIRCPSVQATYEGQLRTYGMGVHFMNFTSDSRFILVCFQLINSNLQRNNKNNKGIYLLWDIKLNNAVKSWENQKESYFNSLQFANHTKGRYRFFNPCPGNQKKKFKQFEESEDHMSYENVVFSSICQLVVKDGKLKNSTPLFLGDETGVLHLTTVGSLYAPEGQEDSGKECLAALVRAHSTGVDWIGLSSDGRWLFTRGVGDSSILMWRVDTFGFEVELDYQPTAHSEVDVFGEIPAIGKLDYCISSVLSKRSLAADAAHAVNRESEGELYLKLNKVIGRTAMNKRNNICYSSDNQLIIASGSLIILLDIPPMSHIPDWRTSENYFRQSFIKPAENWHGSPAPEIGAIEICRAKKLLCVSTFEKTVRLLFWQVESKSYVGALSLAGYNSASLLRFGENNRTLAVVALSNSYTCALLLVDTHSLTIEASALMTYSSAFKIKAVEFAWGLCDHLITVGVSHAKYWKVAGGSLQGRCLDVGGVEAQEMAKDGRPAGVALLCLMVVERYFVCGADDGSVLFVH